MKVNTTKIFNGLSCVSCQFRCELLPFPSLRTINCIKEQFCVWPESNYYLSIGLVDVVANSKYNYMGGGFVFVDFSLANIKIFTNARWLDYLARSGLRLILVSDKLMEPLAAYWKQRDDRIFSVLYTSDGYENILKSIDKIYLRKINATRARGKMTEKEVSVLFLVLNGCSLKEIAGELQIGSKRLYNIKYSIERKLGVKLFHAFQF
ncbi:hypothetical protein [Symbiopectobacterium purcellii]|uniref:HTH luxR-type domain-containing protein n=1 Tax=Symbiopectobacterium purcellii TaxID=2871826 RepID=A0ABX9AJB6_9ENTR|nr:hypothetical protein [Symbiopectobacterium purcellii]QZN95267.1 hypothetical protein K6K13_18965 [Symbiopectobacterium purcellii]